MGKLSSGIHLCLLGAIVPLATVVMHIQFNQNCAGYLKQAADANTIELALDRITKALVYIEENKLTSGYSSIVYNTEEDNIGYWYNNIKACQKELQEGINSTKLEKTNILMKVRESLTDTGEKGTELTLPGGISRYPNNAFIALGNIISAILLLKGSFKIYEWFT